MRTLWLFIAVIIIAGGLVMALSRSDDAVLTPPSPPNTPVMTAEPTPATTPATTPVTTAETGSNVITEPAEAPDSPTHEDHAPPVITELVAELSASAEARAEAVQAAETEARASNRPPASDEIDGPTLELGMDTTIAHATIKPGEIKRLSDNKLAVDGEWTLVGNGTEESPYEPSWEYLFSAADTYQPRLDENEIPQRIAMLDGMWVRIAGFTAFPLVTGETTEMLVMLNKWDGCCIGVPPTPFDAIEVHLTAPVARGPKHAINFGTITGVLKVDPYLIEDWLVGLYILDQSSIAKDL